jgi:hypothetical protein
VSLAYAIDPSQGSADQIGFFVRCTDEQAAVLYDLLRQMYGTRLPRRLMPSKRYGYTYFFYLPDREDEFRRKWPDMEARVLRSTGPAEAPPVRPAGRVAIVPSAEEFATWRRKLSTQAQALLHSAQRGPHTTETIASTYWARELVEGLRSGGSTLAAAEAQLAALAKEGDTNALRAWIGLYADSGQHDRIVALTQEMREAVLGLPVGPVLANQITTAFIDVRRRAEEAGEKERARQLADALATLRQVYIPELERLQQADYLRRLFAREPHEEVVTSPSPSIEERLSALLTLEPGERIPQLEQLYDHRISATAPVGLRLAQALGATGQHARAAEIYSQLADRAIDARAQLDHRVHQAEEYLAAGRADSVIALIRSDEPEPALRGQLGVALGAQRRYQEALEHLDYAWTRGERRSTIAGAFATACRETERLDKASEPYQELLVAAKDLLQGRDYATIAQLVMLGEFGQVDAAQQMDFLEAFYSQATLNDLRSNEARELAAEYRRLARWSNDEDRLSAAYQCLIDVLIACADEHALAALLEDIGRDHADHVLDGHQRYLLLDEIDTFLDLFPALRQQVCNGYFDILDREMRDALQKNRPLPSWVTDVRRALALHDASLHDAAMEDYARRRTELAERGLEAPSELAEDASVNLAGQVIALVGGHERTRRGVRDRLEELGATVVEVAPSDDSRLSEVAVLDRIRSSTLVVLIVRYMGHDLSTIVDNLKSKAAFPGDVLRVHCRGVTGVFRQVISWAHSHATA